MAVEVSVVIPTRNREQVLCTCLDCLLSQDYPADKYEIVVVDDASTDGTESVVVDRARETQVALNYFRQPHQSGTCGAKNRGIAEARGEIIIFTDDDAFAPPWYISEHVRSHRTHPDAFVDGPAISVTRDQLVPRPPITALKTRALAFLGFWGQEFVNANASCPRESLLKAGGFDETFVGWEDSELCQRLKDLGLRGVRNRRAYVVHCQAGRTDLQGSAACMLHNGKHAAMYYRRYPSWRAKRRARVRYLAYDRVFDRLGWTRRYLTPEIISGLQTAGSPWYRLLRRAYLIHAYADGLRAGFAAPMVEPDSG